MYYWWIFFLLVFTIRTTSSGNSTRGSRTQSKKFECGNVTALKHAYLMVLKVRLIRRKSYGQKQGHVSFRTLSRTRKDNTEIPGLKAGLWRSHLKTVVSINRCIYAHSGFYCSWLEHGLKRGLKSTPACCSWCKSLSRLKRFGSTYCAVLAVA